MLSVDEIIKNIKEESKTQEKYLEMKIKEGTDKLRNTLKQIKQDMERLASANNSKHSFQEHEEGGSTQKTNSKGKNSNNQINNPSNNVNLPAQNNNDSALSSFYMHNNNPSRHIPKHKDRDREKERDNARDREFDKNLSNVSNSNIKEKFNTISTENLGNSKDNFFKKESLKNNYGNFRSNRESGGDDKGNANLYYEQGGDINSESSPGKRTDNFKFSENNFNKASISLTDSKNKEIDSDNEFSHYNLEKKILEQRNNAGIDDNETHDMNDFSKSGTFKSQSKANANPDANDTNMNSGFNFKRDEREIDLRHDSRHRENTNSRRENTNSNSNAKKMDSERNTSANRIGELSSSSNRKFSNNNRNVSNINVNNSNIQEAIKRDLREYLSDLEDKHLVKLKLGDKKWMLEFDEIDPSAPLRLDSLSRELETPKRIDTEMSRRTIKASIDKEKNMTKETERNEREKAITEASRKQNEAE